MTINNNETVYKVTYGPGGTEPAPYTVLKSGGKLKKYTLKPLTLLDIKNVPLNYSLRERAPEYHVPSEVGRYQLHQIAKFDPMTNLWGPIREEAQPRST